MLMTKDPGACCLTVEDAIEQTLEWLDAQGCREPDHERRGLKRSRYRVGAQVAYFAPGLARMVNTTVMTRNLSRSGLSFVHPTLIYPGQRVHVKLPLPDKSVRQLRGKVIRVRPAGVLGARGMYEIGVEWTDLDIAVKN